jgi:hypothetical protein
MSVTTEYECDLCGNGLPWHLGDITVYEHPDGVRLEKGLKAEGDRHFCERCAKILIARLPEIVDPPAQPSKGCRKSLAVGQWWGYCGETDMGQTRPALCTECGGSYRLEEPTP